MAGREEIARWIHELADPDAARRAMAAGSLNAAGFSECFVGSNDWIRDPAFREFTRPFAIDADSRPATNLPPFVVGVAVHATTFEAIRAQNGSPRLSDVPPDQDALEFELHLGENANLDILTTREPAGAGAIARYLAKLGEGIQQIEVNVTDIDRATGLLRTRFALTPIYPATRPGADGTRVNFFLVPVATGKKFLVELVEPAAKR